MSAAKCLTKFITSPTKVAQALDWNRVSGSVLSVNVLRDRIDLAVAFHPSSYEPIQSLPSIPLKTKVDKTAKKKTLSTQAVQELAKIVRDWHVCGLVVNWPVEKEGWCGARCGRVLHTLEQIMSKSNSILSVNRPMCLWDYEHHIPGVDVWGRNAIYSLTSDKVTHKASQEQYRDHYTIAANIWNDFCRAHWPEIYYKEQDNTQGTSYSLSLVGDARADAAWLDDYEDTAVYAQAAL